MIRQLASFLLVSAVALVALSPASAQPAKGKDKDKERDPEGYPRFFKKPETVDEFWKALTFEIDVGRYDLAARQLHGLLDKKPTDDELVALQERVGTIPIQRLRNIRRWSEDDKENKQALK